MLLPCISIVLLWLESITVAVGLIWKMCVPNHRPSSIVSHMDCFFTHFVVKLVGLTNPCLLFCMLTFFSSTKYAHHYVSDILDIKYMHILQPGVP